MIEDITIQTVTPGSTLDPGEDCRFELVEATCPKDRNINVPILMVINFDSNSVRMDQADAKGFHGLRTEIRDILKHALRPRPVPDD